ncbi:MAG: hypothetical protein FWF70_04680 [Bacteroidetes bacterium]|nr:hypothetical protein [Bacteroidota bacterium]MCL1969219.1 hypothetical protein [Bacteroidota bacterium]
MSPISDGEPLSLRFIDTWNVPVMFDEATLLFGVFAFPNEEPYLINTRKTTFGQPSIFLAVTLLTL